MRRFYLVAQLTFLALSILFACACSDDSSGTTPDGDSQTPDGNCLSHDDCRQTGTNMTCNLATGQCMDQGLCETDMQCIQWYGTGYQCSADGICVGSEAPDGDNASDGDGSVPDGDDQPDTDGDSPVEGCEDFSGLYEGVFACSDTQTLDTFVSVNWISCKIDIVAGEIRMSGDVLGRDITLSSGKNCNGNQNAEDGIIQLTCDDGCQITLTPKSDPEHQGMIQARPSELYFGAAFPNEAKELEAVITNLGEGDLTIHDIFFGDGTPSWYSILNPEDWQLPKTIASGNDDILKIKLMLGEETATEGMIVILSDAANMPVLRIKMESEVKAIPKIEIEPPSVQFGSAPPGMQNSKFFLIRSTGGAPASVNAIEMVDDQDGAFFFGDWNTENADAQAPFVLESSFSVPVTMYFKPIEGVHAENSILTGLVKLVWVNKEELEEELIFELVGKVTTLRPPCLDIQPLGGTVGFGGLGEAPGPGIKFGNVEVQTNAIKPVIIRNCGDQPLIISNMIWQNPMLDNPLLEQRAFNETPGSFIGYTIQRNESVHIDINFFPRREGVLYSSAFLLNSNATEHLWAPAGSPPADPAEPVKVGVSGIGARRGIEVLPSKLDFQLVTIGCCSRSEEVSIYNIGDLELTITEIAIGAGSDERFEIVNPPDLPVVLGGEGNPQRIDMDVRFCAEEEGEAFGRLEVTSDDENQSQFIVPLQGEGTTLSHIRDEFTQVEFPMVDILWVVDCSGSMNEERNKVQRQARMFVEDAVHWDADMHLGIVSCDIREEFDQRGQLQGEPNYLENRGPNALTSEQFIDKFKDKVSDLNGCDGGQEAGLEAAHLALSDPLISNENDGFLRDMAKLAIIWLADEEDQSVPGVDFYIDFFRSIKGMRNVNMIDAYAIVGDWNNGCEAESSSGDDPETAAAGKRYITVADACNVHDDKHFYSICEDNYRPVFENMSQYLFAPINQFFLSALADERTIVVTINGSVDNSWEYDEDTNSIVFPDDAAPPAAASIVVEYDTLCLQ